MALQRAVKKRLIPYNPVKDADPPPYSTAEREYFTLSMEDVTRFIAAARGDRFEALWIVGVLSGMRPAELRGLGWKDLDLPEAGEGLARIRHSSTELIGQKPKLKGTKTGKPKIVPLMPEAVDALREHKVRQNEERLKLGELWEDNGLVCPTATGTIINRSNLTNRHYKPILKKAGLPKETRLYDLRHTFGMLWVDSGEDIATLSKVLGHARVSTTADNYVHPSDRAKTDAMRRFGRRFGAQ